MMEHMYFAEKERLFAALHNRTWDIAFICISPSFSRYLADTMGCTVPETFRMQELMGNPIIEDENQDGCFSLILRSGKCSQKRF